MRSARLRLHLAMQLPARLRAPRHATAGSPAGTSPSYCGP